MTRFATCPPRWRLGALLAWIPLASTGCGDEGTTSTVTARDSAGIRIVENHGAAEVAPVWSISPEPIFRIGWEAGEPRFEDVATGRILADGWVVVGDRGSQLIRTLSASGEIGSTFGGRGEGPGEFTGLSTIVPLGGDTLLVQQIFEPRLSYFERNGELVGTGRFENMIGGGLYGILGRLSDGDYALWPTQGFMGRPGGFPAGWLRFPVLSASADFTRLDTIAVAGMTLMGDRGNLNPVRPSGSVTVAGDLIVHATNDRPQVTWIDGDGAVRQMARWDAPVQEATDDHWAVYEQRYRGQYADRYEPAELEQRLADRRRDFAGPVPFFGEAHGDRAGNVWLGEYDLATLGPGARRYSVVSAEGRWLGTLRFTRDVTPLDITDDLLLGVEFDDLDVQAVVLYGIEKPEG